MTEEKPTRRTCELSARVKDLDDAAAEALAVTILELGPDSARVRAPARLTPGANQALDFRLPTYTKEINVIARASAEAEDELEFVHIPLFERNIIINWMGMDPPPTLAGRLTA